jgi:hypothetical protein
MNPFPLPSPAAFTHVLQQVMLLNPVTPVELLDSGDARQTDRSVAESGQMVAEAVVELAELDVGRVDVGVEANDVGDPADVPGTDWVVAAPRASVIGTLEL